jgi:hypothetical protein
MPLSKAGQLQAVKNLPPWMLLPIPKTRPASLCINPLSGVKGVEIWLWANRGAEKDESRNKKNI